MKVSGMTVGAAAVLPLAAGPVRAEQPEAGKNPEQAGKSPIK